MFDNDTCLLFYYSASYWDLPVCTDAEIYLCSFYIHKSVLAEMDNSPCDMLDHANVDFSPSPLHKLLNLLNLKPSNKVAHWLILSVNFTMFLFFPLKCWYAYHVQDAFSLDDLTTRKLKQILRVSNKPSCCFLLLQGFSMCPYTVASIIGYFPNEVYLLLCLFYSSVVFFFWKKHCRKLLPFLVL